MKLGRPVSISACASQSPVPRPNNTRSFSPSTMSTNPSPFRSTICTSGDDSAIAPLPAVALVMTGDSDVSPVALTVCTNSWCTPPVVSTTSGSASPLMSSRSASPVRKSTPTLPIDRTYARSQPGAPLAHPGSKPRVYAKRKKIGYGSTSPVPYVVTRASRVSPPVSVYGS